MRNATAVRPLLILTFLMAASAGRASEDQTEEDSEEQRRHVADAMHASVDDVVQNTVQRIDSFFVDSEHATFADEKTRVRLRLNTDYVQNHGWEVSPKIKLNLVLPGLNNRLRLVLNDDQSPDADQSTATDDSDNDIALRWIGKQNKGRGYSFDLGLRIKSGELDPFGRINAGIEYPIAGQWVGQTTNRLYYYSKTGWRNDLRQYFNHSLGDDLLFRSRTRLQYFEENVYNPFIEQKFSVFHSLTERRKLAYEVLYRRVSEEDSPFDPDEITIGEQDSYHRFMAQVRFRQQLWREWFYVEFWPIVAWPEERDYDTTLAARFRIEVNLGGTGDRRLDE